MRELFASNLSVGTAIPCIRTFLILSPNYEKPEAIAARASFTALSLMY
jgi:hypothetical protein